MIYIYNRPKVKNSDGSYSTVRSISIEEDGKQILIPTVVGNKVVSNKEAIDYYHKTGQHLGQFASRQDADAYANQLHNQQAQYYSKDKNNMAINLDDFDNQDPNTVKSYLNALAQSGQLGVMDYASTLQKAGSKVTQGIGNFLSPTVNKGLEAVGAPFRVETRTPQNTQQEYEKNIEDTYNNPDVKNHPIVAGAGRIAGNLAIQYPIMKAAGLGTSPAQLFSEAGAQGLAKNVVANTLFGAAFNQKGQDSVFSPEGAIIGAAASIPMFAAQTAISNYLTKIGQASADSVVQTLAKDAPKSLNLKQNMIQSAVSPYTGMVDVAKLTSSVPKEHPAIGLLNQISPLIGSLVQQGGVVGAGAAIGAGVGAYEGGAEGMAPGAIKGAAAGLAIKGLMASPQAISKILSYSPMKSLLTQMNSLGSKVSNNPELVTYMANKFNKYLTNAGVDLVLQNGGASMLASPSKSNVSINLDDFDDKSVSQ